MKKFSVLMALALLAVAGTGYAQTERIEVSRMAVPQPMSLFDGGKVIGLALNAKVDFGNQANYDLILTQPCRLVDTTGTLFAREGAHAVEPLIYGGGPFYSGETRTYPLSGTCLEVPQSAVAVALRVMTIGLTDNSLGCSGRVDTTTLSTPGASGGRPNGCGSTPFVVFETGRLNSTTGFAMVKPAYSLNGWAYYTIGFTVGGGTTHVIVDVLGYIKRP